MNNFEYASPATIQEAVALLGPSWDSSAVLAGGTDLLALMKDDVYAPKRVVNIKGIKELGGISKTGSSVRIGATVTVQELLDSAVIRAEFPALIAAAHGIASPQIRNMGTVGGDICQRPRCWYFRQGFGLVTDNPEKGRNEFHAIFSSGKARFVSASSFGPALIALGATVKTISSKGKIDVPAAEFFVEPKSNDEREISIQPNELVTEIVIPAQATRNATYEVRQKTALDWPLATASVALKMKGAAVADAKIVLGHVAPTPWIADAAAKALVGKTIDEKVAEETGKAAVAGASPLSENGYKVKLAQVAVKRALLEAARRKA
jgi:xanthine dehydrogenase YagS FAD-binding subunit